MWNFAPPPEPEDTYTIPAPGLRSNNSSPGIVPYEDPAYGERPSYKSFGGREHDPDRYDEIQRERRAEREAAMANQQDEIMTDVYQAFDDTKVDEGVEESGTVDGMQD